MTLGVFNPLVQNRHYLIAIFDRERSARTKVVLDIDN
jgi:hypothetical protein